MIPCDEEHLTLRCYLINGLAACKLKIEVNVFITRLQLVRPFIGNDGLRDIICTEIGISQVIIERC